MLLDNIRQALCDIGIQITRFDAVFELLYPESFILFILLDMELGDGYLLFQLLSNPWLRLCKLLLHRREISHLYSQIFAKNLPIYQEEL